jgi:hypothetical protein
VADLNATIAAKVQPETAAAATDDDEIF